MLLWGWLLTVTIRTTERRRRVREVLDRVRREQEPVIVCTYDGLQAVLIPYERFDAYQEGSTRSRQIVTPAGISPVSR